MAGSAALSVVGSGAPPRFSREQIDLIKTQIAKGANDQELALFLAQCERTGLDPFSRQIYWISRGGRGSTQVSIDGFRVIAERSGEMDGQDVAWCDDAGVWADVWLKKEPPAAARVLAYRKGCLKPFPGIAKWAEYSQPSPMWTKMPANQLAKCAEALALRKAFPHQLSGLYTPDEMAQAGDHEPERVVAARLPEASPVALPPDTVRVAGCEANGHKPWKAQLVDATGAEAEVTVWSEPVRNLAVECAQDGSACVVTVNKQGQLTKLSRWKGTLAENATIDAEVAARDTVL